MEPILIKFNSFLNIYYYLKYLCNEKNLQFSYKNLLDNLIDYWQLSFTYKNLTAIECNGEKHSKIQKCLEISTNYDHDIFYAFYLTCKKQQINNKILFKDIKLRLNSYSNHITYNFKYSQYGYLQIFHRGYWSNISYIQFDIHTSDLACQYFGHMTGTLSSSENIRGSFNDIYIKCRKNVTNLENCEIIWDSHFYPLKLKSSHVFLICFNDKLACDKIQKDNVKIIKFLKKCYYLYKSEKLLNYSEINDECLKENLNLISINEKDEARFIFNQIIIEKEINNTHEYKNLYQFNYHMNNTFIPFCMSFFIFFNIKKIIFFQDIRFKEEFVNPNNVSMALTGLLDFLTLDKSIQLYNA